MDDDQAGVPEWVVTYGDMMSLLLTFFIMLVSLSDVVAEEKYLAILNALHQHLGYNSGPQAPPGKNFPLNAMMTTLESLGSHSNKDSGYGGIKQKSVAGNEMKVYRTREGESRIAGAPIHYEPLTVEINDNARAQLAAVVAVLVGKPNKIVIRVYASQTPVPADSKYADKIALTYARGRQVYRYLVSEGVDYKRLRVDAMSDTESLSDNKEEGPSKSDRVEVIILNAFADEFVGPRDELN